MKLRDIIADAAGLVGKERLARFLVGASSDTDGNVLFFVLHAEYAEPRGEARYVVYDYIPKIYSLSDDVGYKNTDISRGVLAMGLASEICLAEGRFKESVLWRKRYSDGVSAFTLPKNARAKSRCFI